MAYPASADIAAAPSHLSMRMVAPSHRYRRQEKNIRACCGKVKRERRQGESKNTCSKRECKPSREFCSVRWIRPSTGERRQCHHHESGKENCISRQPAFRKNLKVLIM